jgi:hypothetical protein
MVVKQVGVWSIARISGALYAGLGLVIGAVFALVALLGAGFASTMHNEEAPAALVGGFLGVGAVVALPIFYGVMGLVGGALMAWLYNVFAGFVGGIEVTLE